MPRKNRDLIRDLKINGFFEIKGGGKGSHRKFSHLLYQGAITISGHEKDDAKPYQEKQIRTAIESIKK